MIIKKHNEWKPVQAHLGLAVDGMPGPKTLRACALALGVGEIWSHVQAKVGVNDDGIPGPKTAEAVRKKLGITQTEVSDGLPTETEVRSGKSIYGASAANLVAITLPYPMRLSWELKTTVSKMSCHAKVADKVQRIFIRTLEHYGLDRIRDLGLDIFGGCFNDRAQVGGSKKSMHAWGIAIDLDPDKNALKMDKTKARFAKPEYEAFWQIVEDEGGYSLGREKDFDWMHFQFARR